MIVPDMGIEKIDSVGEVLFGRTRGSILGLLYGHPDESFYFQEIRRRTDAAGVGAVQRELRTLEKAGLIEASARGNQIHYRANQNHSLYPELRSLIAKTVGVFDVLRRALAPFGEHIAVAFVYGSVARYEEKAGSDIDVMVIGDVALEDLVEQFAKAETTLRRTINPTLYEVSEFRKKLAGGNHFVTSVVGDEKVFLIGEDDELRAIREERLDHRGAEQR